MLRWAYAFLILGACGLDPSDEEFRRKRSAPLPAPTEENPIESRNVVERAPADVERDQFGYPRFVPDKLHLLTLLRDRRFDELDSLLSEYNDAFESDVKYEDVLFTAFDAFDVANEDLEAPLSAWVAAGADNGFARLARAVFYQRQGWERRGARWARETSAEQFEGMRVFFENAEVDLTHALEHSDRFLLAFTERMTMARARGRYEEIDALFEQGKQIAPASYRLHYTYLMAMLPRWGGSWEEIDEFLAGPTVPYADNARLEVLRGVRAWDEGRVLRADEEYRAAVRKLNEALSFGPSPSFYQDRALSYFYAEHYDAALSDLERALELYPQDPDALHWHGRALAELGRLDETVASLELAIRLDPGEREYQDFIGGKLVYEAYELAEQQELEASMALYDKAVELSPTRADSYYWRGRARLERRELDLGLADLERAIELDPAHFEAYRSLDWALAKRGEWDAILERWNAFLEIEPDHADAIFERSGTYFHKGDMDRALADAGRACELGNEEACKIHERYAR